MNGVSSHWIPVNVPAGLIALIITLYWARVIRMARKTRRETGNAANLVPPEPLGKALRLVWGPVVTMWVVLPWVAAYGRGRGFLLRPLYVSAPIGWAAAGVAVVAFIATVVCWRRMGRSWRMGIAPGEKTSLVFNGPFAYVRHPIYALSSILMMATLAAVPTLLMLVAAVLHLLLLQWEARREEAYLLRTHGDSYLQYRRRVGRFVPKLFSSAAESGQIR